MKALAEQIGDLDGVNIYGRVVGVRGLMVEVAGPIHAMSVGARLAIETGQGPAIPCEVVGFHGADGLPNRRAGHPPPGPAPLSVPRRAAAGPCPHAGGRAARSRCAGAQYLPY